MEGINEFTELVYDIKKIRAISQRSMRKLRDEKGREIETSIICLSVLDKDGKKIEVEIEAIQWQSQFIAGD